MTDYSMGVIKSIGQPSLGACPVHRAQLQQCGKQPECSSVVSLSNRGARRTGRLGGHLARWRSDPVFIQRTRIRDLRRAHPELLTLEEAHRRAATADAAAPQFARLGQVEQELVGAGKAVAGLAAALERATEEKRAALRMHHGIFG